MTIDPVAIKDWLQLISYVIGIVGVPWGVIKYLRGREKERELREKEAFAVANQRYVDYLRLCLQYPELDAFDLPRAHPGLQASGIDHRKLILLSALTAMLETAFVLHEEPATQRLREQWSAWERYARLWAAREDFRAAWRFLRPLFHDRFVDYMKELIEPEKPGPTRPESGSPVATTGK